jgi:hypothetical protein
MPAFSMNKAGTLFARYTDTVGVCNDRIPCETS